MQVPAIILAAGASRRLGRPKQLVRAGEETLLGRTARVTLESGATPVFVVLGAHRESIAAQVDLSAVTAVLNPDWESGMASSVHAGLSAVERDRPEAQAVLLLVCDQPWLTAEHLRRLLAAAGDGGRIAASAYAGLAGIPAVFPRSAFPQLMALEGDEGARSLLRNGPRDASGQALAPRKRARPVVLVDFDGGALDVDTVADLAHLGWIK